MKYRKNVYQSFAMVMQFGLNMIVPILMCTMLGVYIGKKYDMMFIVADRKSTRLNSSHL